MPETFKQKVSKLINIKPSIFVQNISLTLIVQFLIIPLSIILSIIIARYLGTEGTGTFAVLSALTSILVQVGNFGIPPSNVYFTAKYKDKIKNIKANSLMFGLIVGSVLSILSIVVLYFYPATTGNIPLQYFIVSLISVPFSLTLLFFQNILMGQQKIIIYNLINLFSQILMLLAGILIIIVFNKSIFEIVFAQTIISALICISVIVYSYNSDQFLINFDLTLFKEMFMYGIFFYMVSVLYYLVLRSDMIIINYYLDPGSAGIYSVAVTYCGFLYIIPTVVGAVLFPKLSAERSDQSGQYTCAVARVVIFVMLIACIISVILFLPLVKFLYGESFVPAIGPFLILLPGTFFISVETIFVIYISSINRIKILPVYWVMTLLINISLNLLLVPKIGIIGAAFASTISYIFITVVIWKYFQKLTQIPFKQAFIMTKEDINNILKLYN